MVKLEIRNLESSKSHLIDPGGAVLGREGGDAQIKLGDQGVSKKHARIYAKRGTWYLEDLDSANGTYLEDERITSPVVLTPGSVFTMSRQQFEVVQIITEEPEPTRNPRDAAVDEMDGAETNAMEPGDLPDRLRANKGKRPAGKSKADLRGNRIEDDDPPPTDHSQSARRNESADVDAPPPARGSGRKAGAGAAPVQSASRNQPSADADVPAPSFAYFASAVPRAVAYYMKSVPLMAVNPLGTIRKGIAEQPLPALSNVELIAYAFPALLFSAMVGAVCSAIVAIRAHTFSVMMLFPIFPLISAAIGAVVSGLIAHPVLTWLVDKLEGQSDARSRSNMFVMQMTASALLAVPSGLIVLMSLIPLPFIGLLPLVISVVASLVMLFLLFSWFRYFGVVQWFEYVILGLGALLVLQAAYGLVMTTIASIRGFGSGTAIVATGTPTIEPLPGEAPEMTAARQKAAELAAAGDAAGAAKVMQEASERMQKAMAAAGATGTPSSPPSSPTATPDPPPTSPATAAATPPSTGTTTTASATSAAANPPATPDPPPTTAAPPSTTPEARPGKGKPSYPEYRLWRADVEKAINDDPTVLKRNEVKELYRRYLDESATAGAKVKPERGPGGPALTTKLKEVEVYEATWRIVAELHRALFK
jgi:FHA domain-containing protein